MSEKKPTLPSFLDELLNSTDLVIHTLERNFKESVTTEVLQQDFIKLHPDDWPAAGAGEKILQRKVLIKGSISGHIYLYATSRIRIDKLDRKIKNDLMNTNLGIGEIIKGRGLNTERLISEIEFSNEPDINALLVTRGDVIRRSYSILLDSVPVIILSEYFPVQVYARQETP